MSDCYCRGGRPQRPLNCNQQFVKLRARYFGKFDQLKSFNRLQPHLEAGQAARLRNVAGAVEDSARDAVEVLHHLGASKRRVAQTHMLAGS